MWTQVRPLTLLLELLTVIPEEFSTLLLSSQVRNSYLTIWLFIAIIFCFSSAKGNCSIELLWLPWLGEHSDFRSHLFQNESICLLISFRQVMPFLLGVMERHSSSSGEATLQACKCVQVSFYPSDEEPWTRVSSLFWSDAIQCAGAIFNLDQKFLSRNSLY